MSGADRTMSPWRTLHSYEAYVARPWITVSVHRVQLPDGRVVQDYHQVKLPDYTVVFAQTPDRRIILERQYKYGIRRACYVLPSGIIEDNEAPAAAAERELLEETGYASDEWRYMGGFVASANYGCGKAHLFIARNVRKVAEPNSGDLEDMEIVMLTRKQLAGAVRNGDVASLSALAALAWATNPMFAESLAPPDCGAASAGQR
ncbi:MAG: NUDIX hydrolase [Chloroflexota bacterium]|nr:NUDIX hydrolase [Chloroflexota bacterium]